MENYQAFEHLSAATRTTLRCGHGRPKDICGECYPTETKIDRDREFDQTAKTDTRRPHGADGTCETGDCDHTPAERLAVNSYDTAALHEIHYGPKHSKGDECFYCAWPTRHGHKVGCPKNDTYRQTPDEFFRLHVDLDSEFIRERRRSETPGPRTVSPSILEFRIQTLEKEKRTLTGENIVLVERLRVANNRIYQFEQMAAGLAAKIDEFERGFKAATGQSPAEFAADRPSAQPPTPAPHDLSRCHRPTANCSNSIFTTMAACQLPDGHAGECSGEG